LGHTHYILMTVIVNSLLSHRIRLITFSITRNNILDQYIGVVMFLCLVKGNVANLI